MMRINIGRISHDRGARLEFDLAERLGPLEKPGGSVRFLKPVGVVGTVTNTGKCLVVQGTISAETEQTCDRCLADFRREIAVPFEAEFFRQRPEPEGSQGRAAEDDREALLRREEEAFLADAGRLFRGDELELSDVVREEISLALPMQNLCRESCAGLCPGCGANLNEISCDCQRDTADPRMAALQEWLDRQNSGREV